MTTFKIYFSEQDIRRISFSNPLRPSWEEFNQQLQIIYPWMCHPNLKLQYIDPEGDHCTVSSAAEWDCMFSVFTEATLLKLFVVDSGNTAKFNQGFVEPQKITAEDLHQQAVLLIRNYKTREELEQAKSLLLRSLEGASQPANILYHLSCVESLLNHIDDALNWLLKAVQAGFCDFQHMQSDPDLNNLRSHPNYHLLVVQQHSFHESCLQEPTRNFEDEQRLAEQRRIEEEQRLADQRRIEEEQRRIEEEQRRIEEEQRRIEEEQRLAEQRRIEEARFAEQRRIEEARFAEQRRIEEEQRRTEEARFAEQRRIEEEQRRIEEEQRRIEEEQRLAEQRRIEEEQRLAEQRRIEEQRRMEEELAKQRRIAEELRILAEQRRIEEEQRIEEQRRIEEEQRRIEEQRLAEGRKREEELRRMSEQTRIEESRKREEETMKKKEKAEAKKLKLERCPYKLQLQQLTDMGLDPELCVDLLEHHKGDINLAISSAFP